MFFLLQIDIGKWTGDQLRQLGSLANGLGPSDIMKLGKEAFEDTVGVWGKNLNIDMNQLKAMANKAKEVTSWIPHHSFQARYVRNGENDDR